MLLSDSPAISFDDVLIVPSHTTVRSRSDIALTDFLNPLNVPVLASCMDTITGHKMLKQMELSGGIGILHRYMSEQDMLKQMLAAELKGPQCAAVGLVRRDKARIDMFIDAFNDKNSGIHNLWLCVDIAHGDSPDAIDTIKYIKDRNSQVTVIGPNVATASGIKAISDAGAELVRVGIGGGSVCTTRIKTGCGLPTLQSIIDGASVAKETGIKLLADGGVRYPGDVAKALAGGAAGVIIGGMLAGTDCTPVWTEEGDIVSYRGMASGDARAEFTGQAPTMVEGAVRTVKCKSVGSTKKVILEIEEGIRSAMSYVGAHNAQEFYDNADLRRHTTASMKESHPHFTERP